IRLGRHTERVRIQREDGMAFLDVTDEQDEALRMSDRMAVMRQGAIEQLGTPQDSFQTPRTQFVAEFMGAANIFTGRVLARKEHTVHLETPSGLRLVCQCATAVSVDASRSVGGRPDGVEGGP